MNIAVIGGGNVGAALGAGWVRAGHTVIYGMREPTAEKVKLLARETGARVARVAEAAAGADVVVLATPWSAAREALATAGELGGKVLVDCTNPIAPGFELALGHGDSGGEQVARWAPGARVVKAFNTTGAENMAQPEFPAGRAAMFVCGDDEEAKHTVLRLAADLGFEAVDAGPLANARLLEPAAMLWIRLALQLGQGRDFAFGLLRR